MRSTVASPFGWKEEFANSEKNVRHTNLVPSSLFGVRLARIGVRNEEELVVMGRDDEVEVEHL